MLVKERMTPNPITIQSKASVADLARLMKENKLKKVPVLSGDKLVGIVTDKDLEKVSPSGATTLSVFEISALLAKAKVSDAMTTDVVTCTPNTYIEDAAIMMRDRRINALVVVEDGKVVGIITESNLLTAFIEMLGGRDEGNRYVVAAENVPGVLYKMGGATNDLGINISHFVFTQCTQDGMAELLVRTTKDGRTAEVAEAFKKLGFVIKDASVR